MEYQEKSEKNLPKKDYKNKLNPKDKAIVPNAEFIKNTTKMYNKWKENSNNQKY